MPMVATAAFAIVSSATLLATATAFQIKASVSIPRMSHLADDSAINTHDEGRDQTISRLVAEKLERIAAGYQTHGDEMKRTLETELELSNKVEKCFFGGAYPQVGNMLLSSKLVLKQRLLEESLEVNGHVVRQLLATPEGGRQLFETIDYVPSAAVQGNAEHDDLGRLMGNGGMIKVGEEAKEVEGYDTALQVIHHTSRDWTAGSAPCRDKTIGWIVSAIKEYAGAHTQLRVLVPGAGLGRLAFDISTCRDLVEEGYVYVEANDSSVTMAFAARQVLHMLQQRHKEQNQLQSTIFPFMSDPRINEVDITKRFEKYVFPDNEAINCYERYYEVKGAKPNLSFTVGDFVSTYSQQAKRSQYDVIATSFFIDTAANIYEYVFIMKHLLDSDAKSPSIWINCGPVQWHPCALLRPTVEELKDILEAAGFELLTWQVAEEPVAYKHPDEIGGSGMKPRYTRSEAYRPLQFAARLKAGADADAGENDIADLPNKVQYSEYLNEVANGRVKAMD